MREKRERSRRTVDEVSFARAKTRHPSRAVVFISVMSVMSVCFAFYPSSF